jgi:hypothetical protein
VQGIPSGATVLSLLATTSVSSKATIPRPVALASVALSVAVTCLPPVSLLAQQRSTVRYGVDLVVSFDGTPSEVVFAHFIGFETTTTTASRQQTTDPAAPLVSRAVEYATTYRKTYSAIVAEEDYQQWTPHERVRLRSDLLLVKSDGSEGWVSFRDVYSVDGANVRDRDDRLKRLFLDPSPEAAAQLQKIKDESARFNIGDTVRNINVPLFPFLFLDPVNVSRFQFKLGPTREFAGLKVRQLDFQEQRRPTIVRNWDSDLDMPVNGWFLVEPETGAVVQTATFYGAWCEIVVSYRRDSGLAMWVPREMNEKYTDSNGSAVVSGTATYSNFRRFQVTVDEKITIRK